MQKLFRQGELNLKTKLRKKIEGLSTGPPLSGNANSSTMLLKGQFSPSYFGFTGDARQTGRLGECVT